MIRNPIRLKRIRSIAIAASLILISGGVGYYLGQHDLEINLERDGSLRSQVKIINKAVPREHSDVDFSLFWKVWNELEANYIDPQAIDPEEMVYGAISGMTQALGDPYTAFLSPSQNRQNKENLSGSFYGVGIQIGYKDRLLTVISPIKNMPAEKAGIMAGDIILTIKDEGKGVDQEAQGISLPEAVSLIRGDRGTEVTLEIVRDGVEEPFEVTIERQQILIPSVELEFVEAEKEPDKLIAHLQLTQFGERTMSEWNEAVSEILSRRPEVIGIVLDLRNNPGGFLNDSIKIASDWIEDGTVVVQQGRYQSQTFSAANRPRLREFATVVLINEGSASASEIVAGALRDRLGVGLVGEKTFGKGTVQEAKDLVGGAGLHITTSKWILPSGKEIGDTGLTPDVEVELVEEEEGEEEVDEQLEKAIDLMLE